MAPSDPQSAACFFWQVKEGSPSGIWYVCPDCVGRRSPPMTICDSREDEGLASLMGAWDKFSAPPFKRHRSTALESAQLREAVLDECNHRCDPFLEREDIFDVCPRVAGIRRASTPELRSSLLRVKERRRPAGTSGLEE